MRKFGSRFARNDSGATALEYGVMAGLITGVIIAAVTLIGTNLNGVFGAINAALAAVPGA
jgi:pilus assembly protein Flp/PilA